jgi:hypothetical protein
MQANRFLIILFTYVLIGLILAMILMALSETPGIEWVGGLTFTALVMLVVSMWSNIMFALNKRVKERRKQLELKNKAK